MKRSSTSASPVQAWREKAEAAMEGLAPRERLAGVLEKYAKLVGPANLGAVTHSGAVEWPDE